MVLPRVKSDLVRLFESLFDGTLSQNEIQVDSRAAATVVMASGGYPGSYEKGKLITGVDHVEENRFFLAGVREEDGRLLTDGGRVLAVTSYGLTGAEAAEESRRALRGVSFEGGFYREDVGV